LSPGNQKKDKTGNPTKRGKAVNIYLHHADQIRIRELSAYLANEGLRVSDSQVIKAALMRAQPDKWLMKRIGKSGERIKDTSRNRRGRSCAVNCHAACSPGFLAGRAAHLAVAWQLPPVWFEVQGSVMGSRAYFRSKTDPFKEHPVAI
jgi:hypothetical protein